MRHERPDSNALLRELRREGAYDARGKLKVFLVASAGMGKTYAMLSEAQEQRVRGVDAILGDVETRGRAETRVLTKGLDLLLRSRSRRGGGLGSKGAA